MRKPFNTLIKADVENLRRKSPSVSGIGVKYNFTESDVENAVNHLESVYDGIVRTSFASKILLLNEIYNKERHINKIEARTKVAGLLRTDDFGYIYKETNVGPYALHFSFQMDSNTYGLQMHLDFAESYFDMLTFISPRVLKKDEHFDETLYTINTINTYVKAFGRFYINDCKDGFMDIAYSLRIPYLMLEESPAQVLKEIKASIEYYDDVFTPLVQVALGKKSFKKCSDFIDQMWGS